jgi:hypothetical protein
MKNMKKFAGILAILLVAGSLSLSAQRGNRGTRTDSSAMKCDSTFMRIHGRQMMIKGMHRDSLNMRHYSYGKRQMQGHRPMMQYGRGTRQMGQRPEMIARGRGQGDMMRRNPGMRTMESIPNLTDKQKEEIAKLREENMTRLQKLRDEQQKAVKEIRDSHSEKVKSILTDEQKKWVEENKF